MRNLILITQPGRQDPEDFEEIAERVRKLDRYIKVFVLTPMNFSDDIKREDWRNPTLTVALGTMGNFSPKRGRFFYNRQISKERQAELFTSNGIRTPRTIACSAGMILDEDEWGPVVVVKTSNLKQTSRGQSASLVQLKHLNDFESLNAPLKERIKSNCALVQEFVPTGDYPTSYRAGVFLGRVIHMMKKRSNVPIPDLANASIEELNIDSNHEFPAKTILLPANLLLIMRSWILPPGLQGHFRVSRSWESTSSDIAKLENCSHWKLTGVGTPGSSHPVTPHRDGLSSARKSGSSSLMHGIRVRVSSSKKPDARKLNHCC